MRVTKNKMAEEKAERSAERRRFVSSPAGLVLLQLVWLLILPLGFAALGKSVLWSLLMLVTLAALETGMR